MQREARQIEVDYGLRRLKPGDGTAAKHPISKEHFKAKRLGLDATSREILRLRVRRWPPPPSRPSSSLCWKRPA
ncbi:hypothetical protein ABT030_46775 [Streptomyces mirabilis]